MRRRIPVFFVLTMLFAGCGGEPRGPEAVAETAPEVVGTDGVTLVQPDIARIATLGGTVTETVYALGLGDNVVGTDLSSLYPTDVMEKPRLGYFRQASTEGILSLNPTLVISLDGLGPPAVAEQLRAAGVSVLLVPEAQTLEAAEARVQTLGRALGQEEAAEAVIARMHEALAEAEALRPTPAPRALFVYARGTGFVSVSGVGTAADTVMRLAGAENAVGAFEGFRPLTAEAVVEAAPDVVVIPGRGLQSLGGPDGLFDQPGLAQTPAGRERRVVAVDDAILLGLGPRVGEGVTALAKGLRATFSAEAGDEN